MGIAVVSYPKLNEGDREWLESLRAEHDPQAGRIAAHFTLVFPVEAPPAELALHVSTVASSSQPIPFTIHRVLAIPDVLDGGGHVFLVPEEGSEAITQLHDRLYGDLLRPHLRTDIPFVPHITVASSPNFVWCEAFAKEIGLQHRMLRGAVDSVDLIEVGKLKVEPIETLTLGPVKRNS